MKERGGEENRKWDEGGIEPNPCELSVKCRTRGLPTPNNWERRRRKEKRRIKDKEEDIINILKINILGI